MKSKCETLGLQPSFGFGDRIGTATPGHVAAMQESGQGIAAIYPQQSIREMTRTNRTPQQVMDDALQGAAAAGWEGPIGGDADHLKTDQDVVVTAEAGFTFFTIDPSDHVDAAADDYDLDTLREKFTAIETRIDWLDQYRGESVSLASGTKFEFTSEILQRAAVKYGAAIHHALQIADRIRAACNRLSQDYEIELSVDETEQPTTLAEHYIIADQCLRHRMKLVSLAPRFIGEFEKGVDYQGDVNHLEDSLRDHAAIAELLGPYKLSLHSGSDKLSMYSALARATAGRFHVKTAGTSYLEALRVVARHDQALFRRIVEFSRQHYPRDKATYHVSATVKGSPPSTEVTDIGEVEKLYLERWSDVPRGMGFTVPGRQILHCTFGSVLTDPELGGAFKRCLDANQDTYTEVLQEHFSRHLEALQAGMNSAT